MKALLIVPIAAALLAASPLRAQDAALDLPDSLKALAVDIVLVRAIGPWSQDGRKGFSRVVAIASGKGLLLYAQWLESNGEVFESKELEGADAAPELALGDIRIETGPEDSSVYFDTPPDRQGMRETYVLVIGQPGDARFGPATN